MSSSEDIRTLSEGEEVGTPVIVIRNWKKRCYLMNILFLNVTFALSLYEAVLPNAVEVQYCSSMLGILDPAECLNARNPHAVEIQTFTSSFFMYRSFVEMLIPGLLSFFLGPWSDMFGRKPLLLSCITGFFTSYALWTWGSSIVTLHANYFIAFSIPIAFSGGPVMLYFCVYCYVCDITPVDERGARLGFLQACFFCGQFIGNFVAPYLVTESYTIPFAISAIFVYASLMFLWVFIDESITVSETNTFSKNPFQVDHLRSLYEMCYKKLQPQIFVILMLVVIFVCLSLVQVGEMSVFYLFLQNIFGWTLADYMPLNCFSIGVFAVGTWVGSTLLIDYFKLHELLILSIISFLRIVSLISLMFATMTWHIYISKVIGSLGGLYGPVIRLFVSKIIVAEDLGKVFCLIGSLESLTPLIGNLLYNSIYQATILTYPRSIFFLSIFIASGVLNICALLVKMYLRPGTIVLLSQVTSVNA